MQHSNYTDYDATKDLNKIGLGFLTLLYFILELTINFQLYKQLSFENSSVTAMVLEHWGKVTAGLGLALMFVRITFSNPDLYTSEFDYVPKSTMLSFAFWIFICIPLSFWFQNWLVNHYVDKATQSDKNKAILVMATHGTVVPHYDIANANYNFQSGNYDFNEKKINLSKWQKTKYPVFDDVGGVTKQFFKQRANFFELGQRCNQQSVTKFGISEGIDRSFFAYVLFHSQTHEKTYKNQIKKFYSCIYADKDYFEKHTNFNLGDGKSTIDSFYYGSYQEATEKYNKYIRYFSKERMNSEWRKKTDNELGFKSTLPPNLSYNQFVNHPDIKKYYFNHVPDDLKKDAVYPFDKNYQSKMNKIIAKKIASQLPDAVLPYYVNQNGKAIKQDIDPDKRTEVGRQAYKAIIMPIVGLGMSIFFLVCNMIFFVYGIVKSFLNTNHQNLAHIGLVIALFWLIAYPFFPFVQHYDHIRQADNTSLIVQWVYYHEHNLSYIYDWFFN